MRWAGHVIRRDKRRDSWSVWSGNMKESEKLGDPGTDGKIMLQ